MGVLLDAWVWLVSYVKILIRGLGLETGEP